MAEMVWVRDLEGGPGGLWRERVDMASEWFSVEAMVCGYHIHKGVWEAAVGKELCVCGERSLGI